MAVKIGNSYVTESAAAYAQSRKTDEKSENVPGELSKQFKDVKFGVGSQPFGGTGTNNISIAPNILRQMANDPEKRMEYEALIYDCANVLKDSANRPGLKAQGFVIDGKGELSMWSIGTFGDDDKQTRSLLHFTDEEKQRLAGRLPKKKSTTVSTDKVDAEIRKLKNQKAQLEQKIAAEANPNDDLQRQLSQLENELRQKDNDNYRRTHSNFSTHLDIKI